MSTLNICFYEEKISVFIILVEKRVISDTQTIFVVYVIKHFLHDACRNNQNIM